MSANAGISKLDELRAKMGELERIKRDFDKTRRDAIEELLKRRKDITQQLRQLGYEGDQKAPIRQAPVAAEGNGAAPIETAIETADDLLFPSSLSSAPSDPRRKRLKPRIEAENRHCPVCEIDGHDLRAHRGQVLKRAFSAEEMRERGLPT